MNLGHVFAQGDIVLITVFLLLVLMSILTWWIIIMRSIRLHQVRHANRGTIEAVATVASLDEVLRLAIASLPASTEASHWKIDEQEVNRNGPSYTIDTLKALREHYGPDDALILVLGSDQFRNLDTWHDWQHLLDYAHLAVTQRERIPLSDLPPDIEKLLAARGTGSLPDTPSGNIMFFRMPPVPLSATQLRKQLAAGQPVSGLLPMGVEAYIRRHGLYGTGTPEKGQD